MLMLGAAVALLTGLALSKEKPDFQEFVTVCDFHFSTEPWHYRNMKQEPGISAVQIRILQNSNPDLLAPGYIFIAPYKFFDGFGPQIFDIHGELVWYGHATQKRRCIDVQPCLINSTNYDHLCYNDAYPVEQVGHSAGLIRVFDNTYTQVGEDFGPAADLRAPDIHELNTPRSQSGKTIIQDVYQIRIMDLTMYRGPEEGHILDGCFQEIDIASREVIFQWCSLDHVPIDITYVYLQNSGNYSILGLAGDGSKNGPWDWFHINSVDRNDAGDYLISSRHSNTIFHVAGADNKQGFKPGEVIWRLGGKDNSFTMEPEFNFSAQHTIRYHTVEPSRMVVYLFNNANEGKTKTAESSSGMLIDLDLENMKATLRAQYYHPLQISAQDQGNLQILPNQNGFIGWGHCNYYTEHVPSGEVLYNAQFGGPGDCQAGDIYFISSFRAWKYPWKGYPKQPPKLVAYAKECSGPVYAYVSWNGATEVASWVFYASNQTYGSENPFNYVTKVPKSGFETRVKLDFALMIYVMPLDADGHQLAEGSTVRTFVPNTTMTCGEFRCDDVFAHTDENSAVSSCRVGTGSSVPMTLGFGVTTVLALSLLVLVMAMSLYLIRRFRISLPSWRRAAWSYTPLAAAPTTLDYEELNRIRGIAQQPGALKETD